MGKLERRIKRRRETDMKKIGGIDNNKNNKKVIKYGISLKNKPPGIRDET